MSSNPARVWASILALALCSACGPDVLEPRDPTPGVPHFKVATYNILSEMSGDTKTIETIGATQADIVCLQEVTPEWREVIRERYSAEYPHMLFKEHTGASGLAVISKYPLAGSDLIFFVPDWHPAWRVNVESPAGWLQMLIIHLRANFSGRDSEVEALMNVGEDHLLETQAFVESNMEAVPTLILGDFNEAPGGPAIEYLESLGYQNVLPLYRPGQFTWRHKSVGNQLNEAIDHILFDRFVASLNAYVLVRGNSDHIPVIAHFEANHPWPELQLTAQVSEALPLAEP